jgi:serine/threonine-protein kinase
MINQTVSHYKILEKLGEGGMGVVYKAEDTKLDRMVALKFLPTNAIGTEDEKTRFVQEAKAAASLSHANIATVFGIDEHNDDMFIAMEFIEGQTLKDKISEGPLKLKDAVKIAKQIAEGLAAAHEKGVVHRDIKSANIMLTGKNQVKIMDFGLAKVAAGSMVTKAGTTLGTIAYMSPEQARGETVDLRSDIFSLGVILYEMITGQLPFKGEYETAIVYSIMNVDPEPLTAVRTGVPMDFEKIVSKLLAKDPDDRYQNIIELPVDLKNVDLTSTETSALKSITTINHQKKFSLWKLGSLPWIVIIIILIAVLINTFLKTYYQQTIPEKTSRFSVILPQNAPITLNDNLFRLIALSPSGSHLVYTGSDNNLPKLFIRDLNSYEIKPIEGTEGGTNPFFKSDEETVYFFDSGTDYLKQSAFSSRSAKTIFEISSGIPGGCWYTNDLFIKCYLNSGLKIISLNTDSAQYLTTLNTANEERVHRFPFVLPGNKAVLYTILTSLDKSHSDASVAVYSFETGEQKILIEGGTDPSFVPNGYIVYGQNGSLWAVKFDVRQLEISGSPFLILNNVITSDLQGSVQYSFSNDGMLAYLPGGPEMFRKGLAGVDRKGNITQLPVRNMLYACVNISPDCKKIALHVGGGNDQIWIYDIDRQIPVPFTSKHTNLMIEWSPDNKDLLTYSTQSGGGIFVKRVDGSNDDVRLTQSDHFQLPNSMSPDSKFLAISESVSETKNDIKIFSFEDNKLLNYLNTQYSEWLPTFSPDGKWIAYSSDETGQSEVYLGSFPDIKRPIRVSRNGGDCPLWNPNGKELFFTKGDKVLSVSVEINESITPGLPRVLFEFPHQEYLWFKSYDYDAENDRFLFITKQEQSSTFRVNIVTNWFEEIKRLDPANKN